MKVRVLLAVLVALAIGAGAGYAVGAAGEDTPELPPPVAATLEPMPADPDRPVEEYAVDPDDPPLETTLDLRSVELSPEEQPGGAKNVLRIDVPKGWDQGPYNITGFAFSNPEVDGQNTYQLVVEFIRENTISTAISRRTAELESAERQGNFRDLVIEPNLTGDGFEASFTDVGGYRRISIERFYPGPEGRAAVTIRATGRRSDEQGLGDLISRISSTYELVER